MEESPMTDQLAVLVVDDEENILRAMERLFFDEEFETLLANSGEEGLQLLRDNPRVAVILSDQRMPGMTGAQFLEQARSVAPDAVRMVLTGYADITAATDAINKGGAARYLAKPWDDGMLVQTIREGVTHYRMLLENRRLQAIVQRQNEELKEWNANLKNRVLEQTAVIRRQNEELAARNERVEGSFHKALEAFGRMNELRGNRSQTHARNVETLAMNVARELGLPTEEQELIRVASQLHDIGEIGISEELLGKRMKEMNREELRIYLQHAVRGQALIDTVEDLRPVGELIRHHHEWYNGNGQPDGLAKEAIPLGARIIAFADWIDREMGTQRGEAALSQLERNLSFQLGISLDPALAGPFKRVAKYHYYGVPPRFVDGEEAEYHPNELVEGLQVTRDVYSGTGLLLLGKGTVLDRSKIDSIRRYYQIDPPQRGVFAVTNR